MNLSSQEHLRPYYELVYRMLQYVTEALDLKQHYDTDIYGLPVRYVVQLNFFGSVGIHNGTAKTTLHCSKLKKNNSTKMQKTRRLRRRVVGLRDKRMRI